MKVDVKGTIVSDNDGWIYDWLGIQATYPGKINKALEDAKGAAIEVEINSGGGDVFAGSEIYTALRNYKGSVNIRVVGVAASAASVIAMAGKCEMSPTAQMMVHNVSSYADGDTHDMAHMAEVLANANKAIAAAYVGKTGMSENDALEMMDKETWLTAEQALEKGLIDKIMFSDNTQPLLAASYGSGLLPKSVIDRTREYLTNSKTEKAKAEYEFLNMKEILK